MLRPFSFIVERLTDISERFSRGLQGRGRGARWLIRIAGLAVAALAVTQLIPTLADEATPPPNEILLPSASDSDSVVVVEGTSSGESTGGDNSEVTPGETQLVTYATTETETITPKEKVRAKEVQSSALRIPASIKVDPRSVTALLPLIDLSGEGPLLACVSGVGLRFDSGRKGFVDDVEDESYLIDGDLTGALRISGSAAQILGIVNADGGLRVWSSTGKVVGQLFSFSLTAVSDLTTESELCGSGNTRQVAIEGLGIGLETKKGGVQLNR